MKQADINKKLKMILNNKNPYASNRRINYYPIKTQNAIKRKKNTHL